MNQWQGENDFALFRSSAAIKNQQIWQAFYRLHKDKIAIQNETRAIEKLQLIIEATFKLSIQKGFSLTSLRDLCLEAKMSMGSIYSYIGSKSQLAEMIHQFLPYMFDKCVTEPLQTCENSTLHLFHLLRGHVFLTESMLPWFFFAFMETKHLSRETKQLAKRNELKSEQIFEDLIRRGQLKNTFQASDVFLSSMMIKSLLQNWYIKRRIYHQRETDCEVYIKFIETSIASLLGCSPPHALAFKKPLRSNQ